MTTTIFVRLLGEGIDCWCPVEAANEGAERYRITGPMPDGDEWEFEPGELVVCSERDGQLIATSLCGSPSLEPPQRTKATARWERLSELVEKAVSGADPIGLLAVGAPADEYRPEIGTILPRLSAADSEDDVLVIVHEEFVRWFGASIAGPTTAYRTIASRIWDALREFRYAD